MYNSFMVKMNFKFGSWVFTNLFWSRILWSKEFVVSNFLDFEGKKFKFSELLNVGTLLHKVGNISQSLNLLKDIFMKYFLLVGYYN